jgi:RNA-directed DNA polymerase
VAISHDHDVKLTRYADDIVFSGIHEFRDTLIADVNDIFINEPWEISRKKTELSISPNRLKVHGLLVHGDRVRLTKGYRNKIRAFRHLLSHGRVKEEDVRRINGHIRYSDQILFEK